MIYQTSDPQLEDQNTRELALYKLSGMGRPTLIGFLPYPHGLSLPQGSRYSGSRGAYRFNLHDAHSISRISISSKTEFSSTESLYLMRLKWSSRKGYPDITTKSMDNHTSRDTPLTERVLLHDRPYKISVSLSLKVSSPSIEFHRMVPLRSKFSVFLEKRDSTDCLYFGARRCCDTPPESSLGAHVQMLMTVKSPRIPLRARSCFQWHPVPRWFIKTRSLSLIEGETQYYCSLFGLPAASFIRGEQPCICMRYQWLLP